MNRVKESEAGSEVSAERSGCIHQLMIATPCCGVHSVREFDDVIEKNFLLHMQNPTARG